MYVGIILFGIILSGATKNPWPFIVALVAVPLKWYWDKYGNPYTKIKTWWQGTRAASTPGATPAKTWTAWLPLKTRRSRVIVIVLGFTLAFLFQPTRDRLIDTWSWLEVPKKITGTETVRSILANKLDGLEVCDLEPKTSYVFVRAKTEKRQNGDETSYTIKHKASGSTERAKITGDLFPEPEKLPYPDKDYAGGLLVNGLPPGRTITTNDKGCFTVIFNMEGAQYFDIVPISIGITFKKSLL